jgi:hypothetical protein
LFKVTVFHRAAIGVEVGFSLGRALLLGFGFWDGGNLPKFAALEESLIIFFGLEIVRT